MDHDFIIKSFKEKLVSSISLDDFVGYFAGNLVETFATDNYEKVSIAPYRETKIYDDVMKLSTTKENETMRETYMKYIVSSYNNYKDFLMDDNETINQTLFYVK